jgi:hypothetical protein
MAAKWLLSRSPQRATATGRDRPSNRVPSLSFAALGCFSSAFTAFFCAKRRCSTGYAIAAQSENSPNHRSAITRRQFPNHVYEHLSGPAWMGSPSHFDETMPSVQHQVSVHLLVRVKPNFVQAKVDSSLIREIEQSLSISLPLCIGLNGDAVNQKVLGIFFQNHNSGRLALNF